MTSASKTLPPSVSASVGSGGGVVYSGPATAVSRSKPIDSPGRDAVTTTNPSSPQPPVYYDFARPDLCDAAMDAALGAAAVQLIRGRNTVEAVQAYIILAFYGPPSQPDGEDRAWTYSGLAIRCVPASP